jgi:transposase
LCSEHGYVAVVVQLPFDTNHSEEVQRMRSIGLDIHRDFAEVAIAEGGEVRSAGRIEMTPEALELFVQSLGRDDRVALEVSGNAWEVARIIRPHVAELVAVSPADTGIRAARAKTDRLDARALAKLLAAGQLDGVWVPDEETRAMRRRLGRRAQLVRVRTKANNEIHAALMRRLVPKPKVSDLFGLKGRRWLEEVELSAYERETVDGCLRQLDFCEQAGRHGNLRERGERSLSLSRDCDRGGRRRIEAA